MKQKLRMTSGQERAGQAGYSSRIGNARYER